MDYKSFFDIVVKNFKFIQWLYILFCSRRVTDIYTALKNSEDYYIRVENPTVKQEPEISFRTHMVVFYWIYKPGIKLGVTRMRQLLTHCNGYKSGRNINVF